MIEAEANKKADSAGPREPDPKILFLGREQPAFDALAPVFDRLRQRNQRVGVVLCAPESGLRRQLSQQHPGWTVAQPPEDTKSAEVLVRQLKVRAAVVLTDSAPLTPSVEASFKKLAIPMVFVRHRDEHGERRGLEFRVAGSDGGAWVEDNVLSVNRDHADDASADRIVELLVPLAGQNRKWNHRGDRRLGRWLAERLFQVMDNSRIAANLRIRRFDTMEALGKELGHPQTILCLGNGPSSEDPRLHDVEADALFRVNHSWMSRQLFTNPDVVFTGGKSTMRAVRNTVIGVQGEIAEKSLLMTRGLTPLKGRLRYFVVDRLGDYLRDFDWGPYRPTNGASMIAMAVALRPRRLVIGGIDLFQHPGGSYPGDQYTVNAYTPAHTLDKELAFMFSHLDRFDGEIIIIGDVLERAWRHHRRTECAAETVAE